MILWPGYCPTHAFITEDDVKKAKDAHPGAVVMAHPECTEPVKAVAISFSARARCSNLPNKATPKAIYHRHRDRNNSYTEKTKSRTRNFIR